MFKKATFLLKRAFLSLFLFSFTTVSSQTIIEVTEAGGSGWEKEEQHLGKISFANGPSQPPLQKGSLKFDAPVNGHARHIRMRNNAYSGVLLSAITELSYSTYVQKAGSTRDAPLLVLLVDLDGDGQTDGDSAITHLFFIPRFQNPNDTAGLPTKFGWYKPRTTNDKDVKWQYPVRQGVWQTWDALHGSWYNWTKRGDTVDTNPPMYTLASFIAQYPNACIINDKNGGGVRLQAGGTPMADNFVGNADAFSIGLNGKVTVYDFEPEADLPNGQTKTHLAKSQK